MIGLYSPKGELPRRWSVLIHNRIVLATNYRARNATAMGTNFSQYWKTPP